MGMIEVAPSRDICRFSIAVSNLLCMGKERLPISSKNKVPPEATSMRPAFDFRASVNAPFSYPNSSLSKSVSGILPRSMVTNCCSLRGEKKRSERATRSLPVPFSPRIRMLASVSESFRMVRNTPCMASDCPIISGNSSSCPLNASIRSFSCFTSQRERRSFTAEDRVASNFSFSHGFGIKSVAPALMARTAFSVSA